MKKYDITRAELHTWTNHQAKTNGFIIEWTCKKIGFGELTFHIDSSGKWQCDTECMSKEFIDAVLKHFFDTQVKYNQR